MKNVRWDAGQGRGRRGGVEWRRKDAKKMIIGLACVLPWVLLAIHFNSLMTNQHFNNGHHHCIYCRMKVI